MAKPGGPGDPGDPPGLVQKERDALKKVKVVKFGVTPIKVDPFSTVTATWNVTVPTDTGFDIFVKLQNQAVAPSGSKTIQVASSNIDVQLGAAIVDDPTVGVVLRGLPVVVNTSDCQTTPFIPASLVTTPIKNVLDAAFGGGGNFSLKPGGSTVTAGNGGLVDIQIPIAIDVPNWFDADMNIHIQLTIAGGNGKVFVAAPVVDPQVNWSLLSNLLTFGCTDAIGSGMSQISKVFLEHIVDAELRPTITQELQSQVDSFVASLEQNDPQHRTFVMTSLLFTATSGLQITACPKPSA